MNGIKMSDCRFYVNEVERVVVCVIPNTKYLLEKFFDEHFRFTDLDIADAIDFSCRPHQLDMPSSFMGKAVCSEQDEWNEELGRMIAFSRAKDKCYRSFFKRANAVVQNMDRRLGDMIELFNQFGEKLESKRVTLETKIEDMTQKE